jgi:hypothetical protein
VRESWLSLSRVWVPVVSVIAASLWNHKEKLFGAGVARQPSWLVPPFEAGMPAEHRTEWLFLRRFVGFSVDIERVSGGGGGDGFHSIFGIYVNNHALVGAARSDGCYSSPSARQSGHSPRCVYHAVTS